MTYLLDTNVIVDLTSHRGESIYRKLLEVGPSSVAIAAVTLAELEYGEAKTKRPSKSLALLREFLVEIPVLPFGQESAKVYGVLRADLEIKVALIGGNDMLIAATALSQNLTLVTRDTAEFARVEGLNIENWVAT